MENLCTLQASSEDAMGFFTSRTFFRIRANAALDKAETRPGDGLLL